MAKLVNTTSITMGLMVDTSIVFYSYMVYKPTYNLGGTIFIATPNATFATYPPGPQLKMLKLRCTRGFDRAGVLRAICGGGRQGLAAENGGKTLGSLSILDEFLPLYPLVMTDIAIEKWPSRNCEFSHERMVIFHSYIKLPEGT